MEIADRKCLLSITGAFHTDGGIASVNRLLIHALAEQGFRVNVFALLENSNSGDDRYISTNQLTYHSFNGNKLAFVCAVWKAVLAQKHDLVIGDLVNLAAALAPLTELRRCRYVVWLHGADVFPPGPDWEGKLGLTNSWKAIAVSNYTRNVVADRFPQVSMRVCQPSLDPVRHVTELPPTLANENREIGMEAVDGFQYRLGSQMVLHVGRMASGARDKGQESLLAAFPEIHFQFPESQLVLAGAGNDRPRLLLLARSLASHVQAKVFMPGHVQDQLLSQLYETCYLFAMPSAGEGFGLVYLEAMSHGKPCVGANVDATPEVVLQGTTGLLVEDPKSPEQLSAKINWLLGHPQQAHEMGMHGYESVRSRYLFQHFAHRFWQAIET